MRINIVGLGYVGLSTALVFASKGIHVLGIDTDKKKINNLSNGKTSIHEPELNNLLKTTLKNKSIQFTSNYEMISKSNLTFVCVGTPTIKNKIDLTALKKSMKEIIKHVDKKQNHFIVIKSTIVPGTTNSIYNTFLKNNSKISLIYNPEFLREGFAVYDTLKPDRLVFGCKNRQQILKILKLYSKISNKNIPIITTTFENAEFIKYSSNAFLAMKISFANSMAELCEQFPSADIGVIMNGIGLDNRISNKFLNAGIGFGGSCLPKDLQALITFSKNLKKESDLFNAVLKVNKLRSRSIISKIEDKLGNLRNKQISILGLSFKPNTDDVRYSPSLKIIESLLKKNAIVRVYDPKAIDNVKNIFKSSIQYATDIDECIQSTDCCIIATEWDEFKKLSPKKLVKKMKRPLIVDGRRIFANADTTNIDYICVGQGN